jgi:hypothetical protein
VVAVSLVQGRGIRLAVLHPSADKGAREAPAGDGLPRGIFAIDGPNTGPVNIPPLKAGGVLWSFRPSSL